MRFEKLGDVSNSPQLHLADLPTESDKFYYANKIFFKKGGDISLHMENLVWDHFYHMV